MNDLDDFLGAFLQLPEAPDDSEYDELEKRYLAAFGHIPPLEMIPDGISRSELMAAIRWCLELGEDRLFERLGISRNGLHLY